MKTLSFLFAALLFGTGAWAQQTQTSSTIQMQCRTLASGQNNFLQSNEIMINGKACHPVDAKSQRTPAVNPVPVATTPPASPAPATSAAPVVTTVPAAASQPAPMPAASAPSDNAAVPPANPAASTSIAPGSTVYIEPMNGFENYLTAAMQKKKVPLVEVANESQATYVMKGTSDEKKAGWAKIAFSGNIHSDNAASVQMINRQSGAIVFAYAVDKKNTWHGQQTTAEACAKHLKDQIEKK